jgi:hypothetical protein
MKTTSNPIRKTLLVACWIGCVSLAQVMAQSTPASRVGFVRIVNAVAQGQDKLLLLIDGQVMNPGGYKLGDVTGGIGLTPGPHAIIMRRSGVDEGVTSINVVTNTTTTLIPFAEQMPATDDTPAHWIMRILRLRQMEPETTRCATFVSVSQTPEQEVEISAPNGQWTKVLVRRLAIARTPIHYPEGYVPLRCKSGKLPSIPVGKPGNYVVVLYDAADGNMQALNLQDYKYLSAD